MTFSRDTRGLRAASAPFGAAPATHPVAPGARRLRRATPYRRWVPFAVVAAAALAACDPYVQGNGVFHQEDRSAGLAPFVGIEVGDGIRVTATETSGSASPAQTVVVSADANVVQWIRTEVRQETIRGVPTAVLHLFVDTKGGFVSDHPLRAAIGVNGLRYLRATEASRVEASFAAAPHFVLDAAAGADVTLRGPGGATLDANLDTGFAHATDYPVESAQVALARGSQLELRAAIAAGTADEESRIENVGGICEVSGATKLFCCDAPGCP
jgi:hypothetical protein